LDGGWGRGHGPLPVVHLGFLAGRGLGDAGLGLGAGGRWVFRRWCGIEGFGPGKRCWSRGWCQMARALGRFRSTP
jgi:hypothetical protein